MVCAKVRLFNAGSKVLPCGLGRGKSLKKMVSAERNRTFNLLIKSLLSRIGPDSKYVCDYLRMADNPPGTRVNESTALFLSI